MAAQAAAQVVSAEQGTVRRVAFGLGDVGVVTSDPAFLKSFNDRGVADSSSYAALSQLSKLLATSKELPFVFVEGQNIESGGFKFSDSDQVRFRSLFPNVKSNGFPEKLTEAQFEFAKTKNFSEMLVGAGLVRATLPADLPFALNDERPADDPSKFKNRTHEELRSYLTIRGQSSDLMSQLYWGRYIPEYLMEKNAKDYFEGKNKSPVLFVINQLHREFSEELTKAKIGSTTYNYAGQSVPQISRNTLGWREEATSTLYQSPFRSVLR